MRYTQTTVVIGCDRCDTHVLESEGAWGWLIAQTALSESPTATVTYHLCPECREALGTFMANEPEEDHAPDGPPFFCERCNRGEHGEQDARGACVCCSHMISGAAFEAYRAERERLGL